MTVYVDDQRAAVGRMLMCHMLADSSEELLAMAEKIGVARRWLQKSGTPHEHFDICLRARRDAVLLGALEVTRRNVAELIRRKRMEAAARRKPKYCTRCGLGAGEWWACEEPDCGDLR